MVYNLYKTSSAGLINFQRQSGKYSWWVLIVSSGLLKGLVSVLTLYVTKGVCGPAPVQWPVFRKIVPFPQTAQCCISFLLKDWSSSAGLPLPLCAWRKCKKLGALLTCVYGLALKSLLGPAGVACGNRDCADVLGIEGEGGLDNGSQSVSAEHGYSNWYSTSTCLITPYFGCRFKW